MKYKSRYTEKEITVAQHLAEIICERLAQKDKADLPRKFWELTKWKRTFLYQVQLANGLLKLYSEDAILAAVSKTSKIFSLNAPFLDPIIKAEQERLTRMPKPKAAEIPVVDTTQKPRPVFTEKKPTISKLREL
jgi:hypothetical protein